MEKVQKLMPATTLLSMSQRFAAIQKNSPLGSINLNSFQDTSNTHAGPYAQYRPDVYVPLMNQRPSATLSQGSAQNRLILQKFQEALGRGGEPLPQKTVEKSVLPMDIVERSPVSTSALPANARKHESFNSGTNRGRAPRVNREEERARDRRDSDSRNRSRTVPKSISARESRDKPSVSSSYSSRRNTPSSASSSSIRNRTKKPTEAPKKPISERLGHISVFNRLGSPTKKPIHERLSYRSEDRKTDRSIIEKPKRVSEPPSFKARNSGRRPPPRTSRGAPKSSLTNKSPKTSRRVSHKDLDADLDQYMATE